ncbi:MAG: patatin-like phospholipase family protein, partial [Chloroflexia bacterium]
MERQPTALISLVHEPLEALARLLGRKRRRRRVGLALSGGGGRGIAHIGVFSVLMEAGIIPDCVAGTSAGAAAGVLFCRGWSPEQMLRLVRGLSLLDLGR